MHKDYQHLFDPTLITEEILDASGWRKSYRGWMPECGSVCLYRSYINVDGTRGEWRMIGCMPEHAPRTVGDLRRILSGLHMDDTIIIPGEKE